MSVITTPFPPFLPQTFDNGCTVRISTKPDRVHRLNIFGTPRHYVTSSEGDCHYTYTYSASTFRLVAAQGTEPKTFSGRGYTLTTAEKGWSGQSQARLGQRNASGTELGPFYKVCMKIQTSVSLSS